MPRGFSARPVGNRRPMAGNPFSATEQRMSSPVDDQLRQYVVGHITARLQAVRAETMPFPHFVLPEFFPQDVYANLLSWLPAAEAYESFAYEKHSDQNGQSNR